VKRQNALLSALVRKGRWADDKEVRGLPLSETVEVLRDRYGIPHIFAANERDLMVAEGFVHAQERLWQMETLRRFAAGTLAEIAGEAAANLDHFSRLAGFSNLQTRAVARLGPEDRALFQGYVDGVNAYLALAGDDLPLEFRSLKLKPAPYAVEELGGTIPVNAWFMQTNYLEELIAVLDRERLSEEKWNELFASSPGERFPKEDFFERCRGLKIAPLLPAALAFYPSLARVSGSNSWVVSRGPGDKPLLANDPHLDTTVPQVWFFCHLHCPTLNVAGASMSGLPGIVIGRRETVAWSMTNVLIDCTDLYVLRVDPERPTRYVAGGETLEMEARRETIRIAGGQERVVTIYSTVHGTVITEVKPGIEAILALKWYGTLPEGRMEDTTLRAPLSLARARDAAEFMRAARAVASVGQNLVFADSGGRIGKHATGRIPRRRGYSGRLPADGSGGCDWEGFVAPEDNPQLSDPPEGRIVTANHKSVGSEYPYAVSFSWMAPYRFERISEQLDRLAHPGVDDFLRLQTDRYSKRAEHLLPKVLGFEYRSRPARDAAALLRAWDRNLDAAGAGGALFQVFLIEFSRILLAGILKNSLPAFLTLMPVMYTAPDRLLDDRRETSAAPTHLLGDRRLGDVCEQALVKSMEFLERTLGRNRRRWRWGALHQYRYRHPGASGGPASWLLDRGPYPAGGSGSTVNAANFNPAWIGPGIGAPGNSPPGSRTGGSPSRSSVKKAFEVTTIPSMRMVMSLADPDGTMIMGPMGQSGRPGFRHYADMIGPWRRGQATALPLTRVGAESIAVSKTILRPGAGP
jgi:penicillin amidase